MITDQGLSIPQACRDLDLDETAVRRWVQQYASASYRDLLARNDMLQSMSRAGILSSLCSGTSAQSEAIRDITEYIVGFYNNEKLHSKLGYLPPPVYEGVRN